MTDSAIKQISDLECYLVGGAVRDKLLNIKSGDNDWVVVGATEATMLALGFEPIGKDFPVFLHPHTHEQYALARTERKVGKGYKGFEVNASQSVTLEQDLFRRDLTINAMALDANGQLIDPFGGQADLEKKVLRHVSEHFVEDPLRVLRVARFSARFRNKGFLINASTLALMSKLSTSGELDHLVAERVCQEFLSALAEPHPAVFFLELAFCDALSELFPEIDNLFHQEVEDGPGLIGLDVAAIQSRSTLIRFAVLAYLISQCSTQKTAQGNESIVASFCNRLKISSQYRKLAERVVEYTDRVMTFHNQPATEAIELVLSLEGLRNKALFDQFLKASTIILTMVHLDPDHVQRNVVLLDACRDRMKRTDVKLLSTKYKGNQLREKIKGAYLEQVSGLFNSQAPTKLSE